MISATIYSEQQLSPELRSSISDGLDLIGQYMGDVSISRTCVVKLNSSNGTVNPEKVGYGNLDPNQPLHIFAANLDKGREEKAGLSYMGSGIVWLNTRYPSRTQVATTAHEIGHSLGFVLDDAPQRDRASYGHCGAEACVMHAVGSGVAAQDDYAAVIYRMKAASKLHNGDRSARVMNVFKPAQEDFCTPCKADIRDLSEDHLNRLMRNRRVLGRVEPADLVRGARLGVGNLRSILEDIVKPNH